MVQERLCLAFAISKLKGDNMRTVFQPPSCISMTIVTGMQAVSACVPEM
jgi:hypothetical protein